MAEEAVVETVVETPPETVVADPPETVVAETPEVVADGPAWSAGLTSDSAKDFAKTSPDLEHLIGRAVTMREQLSNAIVPPGKDATDSDIAAFRKQIGVPAAADGYAIKMPEGHEETEIDTAFHATLSAKFHELNVPAATADALNAMVNDHTLALEAMVVAQDKTYAEETSNALHARWPDNYDENVAHAQTAMQSFFKGDAYEAFRHMETKDGTLVADSPLMLEHFADLGREWVTAGRHLPPLNEGQINAANDQLADIRKQQVEATDLGDGKKANRLYAEEQALIKKINGNQGVVGSQGRAA